MERFMHFPVAVELPAGTELNHGRHEDSDNERLDGPKTVIVLGPLDHGAYPVVLVENGTPQDEILFWHQPESRASRS